MFYINIKSLLKKINGGDLFSKDDFFILIKCGEQTRKTSVKWNCDNPEWNEAFLFRDSKDKKIILELYDQNLWSPKKLLYSINFPVYMGPIKEFNMEIFHIEMGDIYYTKNSEIEKLKDEIENLNLKIKKIKNILD